VVFDGDCGFCRCSVAWSKRTLRVDVRYEPWQTADLAALGLTSDACRDSVQWVSNGGRLAGHRAVASLLRGSQQPWRLIGVLLDAPGLRLLARVGYAIVKANRSRLVHLCRQPV